MDKENNYKELEKSKLLKALDTSMSGLKAAEVKRRLSIYGTNELPKEKKKTRAHVATNYQTDDTR